MEFPKGRKKFKANFWGVDGKKKNYQMQKRWKKSLLELTVKITMLQKLRKRTET